MIKCFQILVLFAQCSLNLRELAILPGTDISLIFNAQTTMTGRGGTFRKSRSGNLKRKTRGGGGGGGGRGGEEEYVK